jgi:hypothetical protein
MSGAIARTVQPGLPLGLAPRGLNAAPMPLSFPNKEAGKTLDYAVDFSQELAGNPGVIVAFVVVALPVGPGSLVFSNQNFVGMVASFFVGGGVAGMNYTLTVTASLADGRAVPANVNLYVLPAPAPANPAVTVAPAAVITDGLGDVITTAAGAPITTA